MKNTNKSGQDSSWQDIIGQAVYYISDNKLKHDKVTEGRKIVQLNMGSPDHGKYLPPRIDYRISNGTNWYRRDQFFLTKEELLNKID